MLNLLLFRYKKFENYVLGPFKVPNIRQALVDLPEAKIAMEYLRGLVLKGYIKGIDRFFEIISDFIPEKKIDKYVSLKRDGTYRITSNRKPFSLHSLNVSHDMSEITMLEPNKVGSMNLGYHAIPTGMWADSFSTKRFLDFINNVIIPDSLLNTGGLSNAFLHWWSREDAFETLGIFSRSGWKLEK